MTASDRAQIDLHTHSNRSDGTDSPTELMAAAVAAGLDVIALTDHDSTAGWADVQAAIPAGLTVLPGMELSCQSPAPERPIGVHLLAYLFDPGHPVLTAELTDLREHRSSRARLITEAMQADGLQISWDQVSELAAGGTVGRPHIGRALMAAGLVPDVTAAFAHYLHPTGPYYRPKRNVDLLAGIALVRAAGGVPVLAHSRARRRGRIVNEATIRAAAAGGLLGLEVDHPDHDPQDRLELRQLAADLDLIVTGSSDYHGTNKPTPIGAYRTQPDALAAILAASTGQPPMVGRAAAAD